MEKTPFSHFIDLIAFDQSILVLEKEVSKLVEVIKKTESTLLVLDEESEKERLFVHDLRKSVDVHELEMRSLDEQVKAARERSARATTTKEYQSFKKECDQLKNLQHEQEEVLMAAWNAFEAAQKSFDSKMVVLNDKKAVLVLQIEEYDKKKQSMHGQIAELMVTRSGYVQNIPQEWFDKYNRMRSIVPNPVVPVVAGTCGGCSYLLRVQTMMSLDLKKMIECSGCYRLIYKDFNEGLVR